MTRTLLLICLLLSSLTLAKERQIVCAMAVGFPPFQFVENDSPAGIDVEILNAIVQKTHFKIKIVQMHWSDVISKFNFTDDIDCIWGIERGPERDRRFLFSDTLYARSSTLFTLKDSKMKTIKSLKGHFVGADEDSHLNHELIKSSIRLKKFKTKEESIEGLIKNEISAAIMPRYVGHHLAKKYKIELYEIKVSSHPSEVSIAFKKRDTVLLNEFNKLLNRDDIKFEIIKILERWGQ